MQNQVFKNQVFKNENFKNQLINKGGNQNKKFQNSSFVGKNFKVQWNNGRFHGRDCHRWWDGRRGCYIYCVPGYTNYCCYCPVRCCFVPMPMPIPTPLPETAPVDEGVPLPRTPRGNAARGDAAGWSG